MKKIFILLTIFISIKYSNAEEYQNVREYFPHSDTFKAEIWTLGIDPKVDAISKRIIQAIKEKPIWIKSYIKKLKLAPGEAMPYHVNFDVSENEYTLFFESMQNMKMIKTGNVVISLKLSNNELEVEFNEASLPIHRFKIDLLNNQVNTKHANLEIFSTINQNDKKNPLGLWSGIQWKHEKINTLKDSFREMIAIGKMKNEEVGIIYYDLKSSELGTTYFIIKFEKNHS